MMWNEGQREAIRHTAGPALVLAGPGSGKTAVIVEHVRFLLEQGAKGREILVFTFTRAAAAEMEARFRRILEEEAVSAEVRREGEAVTFGTFHSVCFRILRKEEGYTRESLLTEAEKRHLLKEVLFRENLLRANPEMQIERMLAQISRIKCQPEAETDPEPARVFVAYQAERKRRGKLDFDDLLLACAELFDRRPEVLARWQQTWRYYLVDEYQDLNRIQTRLVRTLAGASGHVFAVGDEDQSIYRFRGADPASMMAFPGEYPGAKRIVLDVNYRSVPEILVPAGRLIAGNRERYPKQIRSARRGDPAKAAVNWRCYEDREAENRGIPEQIRQLAGEGVSLREIAVLFRSLGAAKGLMCALAECGIPFVCREIPEEAKGDWAIRDLEAYRNLAGSRRWRRRDLLRILNRPERGLPRTGLEEEWVDPEAWCRQFRGVKGYEEAAADLLGLIRELGTMDRFAAGCYLWHKAGYGDYVRAQCRAREIPEIRIRQRIRAWQEEREEPEAETEGVAILTMHASKGLEFPVVFLPGLNEGAIPHIQSRSEREVEEERRLLYVAVTRAKDRLYLSWVKQWNHHTPPVSRFVKEMGYRL